jgi:hypothetical protein
MSVTGIKNNILESRVKYLLLKLRKINFDKIFYHATTGESVPFSEIYPPGSYAVVGNSPLLLETKKGHFIDKSDHIVRFNDFQIDGYRDFTGSKTSVWMTGAGVQSSGSIQVYPPARRIFITNRFRSFKEKQQQLIKVYKRENLSSFIIFHDDALLRLIRVTLQCIPTTGMLTLLILTVKYRNIATFGFTFRPYRNRYHYYPDMVKQDLGHDWSKERNVYSLLVSSGLLKASTQTTAQPQSYASQAITGRPKKTDISTSNHIPKHIARLYEQRNIVHVQNSRKKMPKLPIPRKRRPRAQQKLPKKQQTTLSQDTNNKLKELAKILSTQN